MSDPDRADRIDATFPGAVRAARLAASVAVGGALGALTWLFAFNEFHRGRIFGVQWTEHDFPDGLGHAFGAEETARAGLYLTLVLGVVAAGVYLAVERRLPGRGLVKGLMFAPVLFLAWGLVFCTAVNARQVLLQDNFVYLPTGLFGWSSDKRTILLGAAASMATGVVIARVTALMRDASWWREHPPEEGLLDQQAAAELLELPEQRRQEGVEGAR